MKQQANLVTCNNNSHFIPFRHQYIPQREKIFHIKITYIYSNANTQVTGLGLHQLSFPLDYQLI